MLSIGLYDMIVGTDMVVDYFAGAFDGRKKTSLTRVDELGGLMLYIVYFTDADVRVRFLVGPILEMNT